MYYLRIISYILVLIGAINWGLIGFMNLDIVALLFGEMSLITRIIYDIIGISAIISLISSFKHVFYRYDI